MGSFNVVAISMLIRSVRWSILSLSDPEFGSGYGLEISGVLPSSIVSIKVDLLVVEGSLSFLWESGVVGWRELIC